MGKAKTELAPPLAFLATLAELLDESALAKMTPLHRAFCDLDYRQRRWMLVQVKRLQAVMPDLDETDCLEILAAIGQRLNIGL